MAWRRNPATRERGKTCPIAGTSCAPWQRSSDYIQHNGMALQPHRSQEKYRLQGLLALPAHIDGSVVGDHIQLDGIALRPRLSQDSQSLKVLLTLPVHMMAAWPVIPFGTMAKRCRRIARKRNKACECCWLFLYTLMAAYRCSHPVRWHGSAAASLAREITPASAAGSSCAH